jgi:hypothetical protein
MTIEFTPQLVAAAVGPADERGYVMLFDKMVTGLGLRITKAGAKSWFLSYRTQSGFARRQTIGSVGDWPLTLAREEARRLRRLVDTGGDPMGARHELRHARRKKKRSADGIRLGWGRVRYYEPRSGRPPRWIVQWIDEQYRRCSKSFKPDREAAARRFLDETLRQIRGRHRINWTPSRNSVETREAKARAAVTGPAPVGNDAPRPPASLDDIAAIIRREMRAQALPPAALSAAPLPTVEADAKLRQDLAEIKELLKGQRQRERNERESVQPILRRLTEIERVLKATELHVPPRTSRRHPMGVP